MAEFLTTNGTSYHIENIIIEAKSKLVLVSPYLQISKTFYERLKDASNKNVAIKIIYGKDELKPNEKNSLAELKNVELFYFQNLHAKCYLNESKMVITSMNMYEFSEKTNREMGVLIDRIKDKDLFEKAVAETLSILQSSEPIQLKKSERQTTSQIKSDSNGLPKSKYQKQLRGYCIRCERRIDYNPEKPYCVDCFSIWAQFGNPDYTENVCHRCGEYEETSMNRSQDRNCYQIWKKELKQNSF
jgi:phosphatidylserine/phosphatidylglycerophosphate/cardiolipin synthase-like enzyme